MTELYNEEGDLLTDDQIMVTLVIDGEEVELPLSQVKATAQKTNAAEKRLEEATRQKREADRLATGYKSKIQEAEDMALARAGDEDALRRVAQSWGLTPEQFEQIKAETARKLNGNTTPVNTTPPNQTVPNLGQLPKEVQEAVRLVNALKQRGVTVDQYVDASVGSLREQGTERINQEITKAIKQDATLSKHVSSESGLRKVVSLTQAFLKGRDNAGQPIQKDDILNAVSRAAVHYADLPVAPAPATEHIGVGSSPSITVDIPAEVREKKFKTPPPVDSPEYGDYVLQRMAEDLTDEHTPA